MHRLTRRRWHRRRRGDRGAVAVVYAIVSLVILIVAALAVDLGNTVARKTNSQTQADFAALAAAPELSTTVSAGGTPSAAVVNAVTAALNDNQPQDDEDACWMTSPPTCVIAADLTDGSILNGEVEYTNEGVRVTSPRARVAFGFATVLGMDGTYVNADATVNVYSGGMRVVPMYAVDSCSFGRQTLTDPANGQTVPVVPTLAYPLDTNTTRLSAATALDSTGATVSTLALNSTGNQLRLTASKWSNTRFVGFFRGDDPNPAYVVQQGNFWLQGDGSRTALAPYSNNPSSTVELSIPDSVAQTEAVWWIRVFNGPVLTGKWSPVNEAIPLRVGDPVLECVSGSSSGNFGTLKLPRTDTNASNWISRNIIKGLQPPLTPTVHQWAVDNPTLAGTCVHGLLGAVASSTSPAVLRRGTNCVDTDTGLPANAATQGMIVGQGGDPGMLRTGNTRAGCDPNGGSSNRTVRIGNTNYSINNDVLTCFLTDGTTSLAQITHRNYNGGPKLHQDIYSSPRFFWVPVLAVEPTNGGSARYSLVDFRPAFITDEQATSAAIRGSRTGTADNGLVIPQNDITKITVVFFNINALPVDGDMPTIDFLGVGTPIVRLID